MYTYSRSCPHCEFRFEAVSEEGVCPECQTFSRVSPNGELVVLIDEESLCTLPHDDPFRNTPLAVLFEWLDSGGGPFTSTARYTGRPSLVVVHRQLKRRFRWLCDLLRENDLQVETAKVVRPANDPDWTGTIFSMAEELHVASWEIGPERHCIVCELSAHGGAIHAVPSDATYHLHAS